MVGSERMETMSYPCSPLLSFSIHEENSYSLWSPQVTHHESSPVDPSPYLQEDCEFFDTIAIDSNDTHSQNDFSVDVFNHSRDPNALEFRALPLALVHPYVYRPLPRPTLRSFHRTIPTVSSSFASMALVTSSMPTTLT